MRVYVICVNVDFVVCLGRQYVSIQKQIYVKWVKVNNNYRLMFDFKQKENDSQQTDSQLRSIKLTKSWSKQQKQSKIALLRQLYTGQPLQWNISIDQFQQTVNSHYNNYSLLLTLFAIAEQPLWRNRVPHICTLIQRLHNLCAQKYGDYLNELSKIENYHSRLVHIFYLNCPVVQEHFRLLIAIYLCYNSKFMILNEQEIAVGLIDAGRSLGLVKIEEYLWMVSQIKVGERAVGKLLKIGKESIQSITNPTQASILLSIITTISNYVVEQTDKSRLQLLMNDFSFQDILIYSIKNGNVDLQRQTLLLCNNLLAKSQVLGGKIIGCGSLMEAAEHICCSESETFLKLVSIRRGLAGFM